MLWERHINYIKTLKCLANPIERKKTLNCHPDCQGCHGNISGAIRAFYGIDWILNRGTFDRSLMTVSSVEKTVFDITTRDSVIRVN